MMKKLFICLSVIGLLLVSCSNDYDDSALWDQMTKLEERIAKLEELCNKTNTNLLSLQTIVTSLQNNDYITDVSPLLENGKIVGYTIKFVKNNPIVIYNGKDGITPIISVKKDIDGIYYWTQDGEFIIVDGQKIKAQGQDGSNAVTPKLEIRDEYWYVSYDNGINWTQLGKATGENGIDGKDGIQIMQDGKYVYFILADGSIIKIAKSEKDDNPEPMPDPIPDPAEIIQFEDNVVKTICIDNWDTNGDGELSYEEAADITDLGAAFTGINSIYTFDELHIFTRSSSVTSLSDVLVMTTSIPSDSSFDLISRAISRFISFSFLPDNDTPVSFPPFDGSRQTTAFEDATLDSTFLLSLRYPLVLVSLSVSLPITFPSLTVSLKKSLYTIKVITSKQTSVASPNNLSILNVLRCFIIVPH